MMRSYTGLVSGLLLALPVARAINLDVSNQDSVRSVASTIAYRMMTYYNGNATGGTPGEFPTYPNPITQAPEKIYWWETAEGFGVLIDYWMLTNDSSYNDVVSQGLLFQTGPNNDYQPPNQTVDLGNDDQVYWGFAAMSAAEYGFPNPPADQPQWLALAQAVFNTQAPRWDPSTCGGGLRWQVYSFNQGYNYKNSASNAGFFNLAARLGAYTHNQTYLDWADKSWDWMQSIGLISNDEALHVYDGSDDTLNCTQLDHVEWTYTAGMAIHGAAAMYVATNDTKWSSRAQQLWNTSTSVFFTTNPPKVMTEIACESNTPVNCDIDQLSFKASYARFLGAATKLIPSLYDQILPYLTASAQAAAAQCTGTPGGDSCGTLWYKNGAWDGTTGVGQEMSALSVIQWTLAKQSKVVFTNSTGGTSKGDSSAGTGSSGPEVPPKPITTGDRAGAGILTAIIVVATIGTVWYGLSSEMGHSSPMTARTKNG